MLRRGEAAPAGGERRSLGLRSLFAWGLIDQGFSSATTFVFTALAARNLGPSGLGTIALGFAAFVIVLGLQRALIISPLLARPSTSSRTSGEALRGAVSFTVAGGLILTLLALAIGLAASGPGARGLLIFAPWLVPTLTHAVLRSWLYREARAGLAAASSAAWLVALGAAAAAGLRSTDAAITAAWGLGSCVALAVAAVAVTDFGVARPRAMFGWFRGEAVGLGSWLAGASIYFSAAAYALIAGISAILGTAAIGGYRAIATAFAPVSFVAPALTNPGMPAMRDAVERRGSDAWGLALRISTLSLGLVATYVTVVLLQKDLVFLLFGDAFREYQNLIVPIAAGQLVASAGAGFSIMLVAARRSHAMALLVFTHASLMFGLGLSLAAVSGLESAAWGISFAEVPILVMLVVFARRVSREPSSSA